MTREMETGFPRQRQRAHGQVSPGVCMDQVHFIEFLHSGSLLGLLCYNVFMFVVLWGESTDRWWDGWGGPFHGILTGFLGRSL